MQLKKHISIFLGFLILISSFGLTFTVHYCKEEIASISLFFQKEEPCVSEKSCCAKEDSHDSCCSNKLVKVEKKSDDIIVKSFQLDLDNFVVAYFWKSIFYFLFESKSIQNSIDFYCDSNAPPLYKLYCQYVFYA